MTSDVLVLCYHAVSETWDCELAVTPAQLERQVASLIRRGYEPKTFADAVASQGSGRTLAITFDDAYRSVLDLAHPVLDRLGAVASVYAPTDWIGSPEPMRWQGIDQWIDTRDAGELVAMDWDDLTLLDRAGWEVGSHTRSHPYLTTLSDGQLADELQRSRSICAEALGRPCETLAYPYGDVDERVAAAAAAAGYRFGAALPQYPRGRDPMSWPRIGIYRWDDDRRFALKVSPTVRYLRRLSVSRALGPLVRRHRPTLGA